MSGVKGEGVKISQNVGPLAFRGQNIEFWENDFSAITILYNITF